jgi:hypothetical protein
VVFGVVLIVWGISMLLVFPRGEADRQPTEGAKARAIVFRFLGLPSIVIGVALVLIDLVR